MIHREAVLTLSARNARQLTLSVKGLVFLFLLTFPWLAALLLQALIWKGLEVPLGGTTLYAMLVVGYYQGFWIPLSTLFCGVAIVADDAEGGTLPYLFGRPVPRWIVFLSKFSGMAAVLMAQTAVSLLGTYLLCRLEGELFKDLGILLQDLAVLLLGVVVYGGLFGFIGIALKKPLFWGFFIGFGWENLVGWLPGFLKRLTLLFHLHTLTPHPTAPEGLQNLMASSESKAAALAFLLVYGAAFIALACWLMGRIEAPAVEREGG